MPDGDPRFHMLLEYLGELHDKKQRDYGSDVDPFANVRASENWGIQPWIGALVRLNDKVHRLQQFAKKGELANESAEDSMLDIAVYALIALILYREEDAPTTRMFSPAEEEQLRADLRAFRYHAPPRQDGEIVHPVDESLGGQIMSTLETPFKHEPCRRCQTERDELAAQRTDTDVTPPA